MTKLKMTLDASKIRGLITTRTYVNKSGEEVKVQEVPFEIVPVKAENQKIVYSAEKYDLVKTHFAAALRTKEDIANNVPVNYIGEGISTVWKNNGQTTQQAIPVGGASNDDDLPF